MNLMLDSYVEQLIAKRVASGQYASPEDVVAAAMGALETNFMCNSFPPGELDRLIEEGRASGPPLDGETVLKELRDIRESKSPRAKR